MADNIITAVFGATRETKVRPRYRYDVGQVLMVRGVPNLPDFYEVHFTNEGSTADATPLIGTAEGVTIPDSYFQSGATIYAYIYVHDEATDGTTVYKVTIPIINRARPANAEPTPEEADIIAQAIVALNENVGKAEDAAAEAEASAAQAQAAAADADESAQSASASSAAASSARTAAQSAAQAAALSESSASDYMDVALDAANRANTQASRASGFSSAAESYAWQAKQSEDAAKSAKDAAVAAKTDAQAAATSAASYRDTAQTAATNAGAAQTAAEAAQGAAETAQTAAETAETNAQTYAGQAAQSAAEAAQSAASAEQTAEDMELASVDLVADVDVLRISANPAEETHVGTWTLGNLSKDTGQPTTYTTKTAYSEYINVVNWSRVIIMTPATYQGFVYCYDAHKTFIAERIAFTASTRALDLCEGTAYIRISARNIDGNIDFDETIAAAIRLEYITEATITQPSAVGNMLKTALSYFNRAYQVGDLVYESGTHGIYGENVHTEDGVYFAIICNALVNACLKGTPFEGSRYALDVNLEAPWAFMTDGTGEYEESASYAYDYLTSNKLAKYADQHGWLRPLDPSAPRMDIRPGDVIFSGSTRTDTYLSIDHCAIVLNADHYTAANGKNVYSVNVLEAISNTYQGRTVSMRTSRVSTAEGTWPWTYCATLPVVNAEYTVSRQRIPIEKDFASGGARTIYTGGTLPSGFHTFRVAGEVDNGADYFTVNVTPTGENAISYRMCSGEDGAERTVYVDKPFTWTLSWTGNAACHVDHAEVFNGIPPYQIESVTQYPEAKLDELEGQVTDLKSQMGAVDSVALGAYPTDTVSGAVASFSDGGDNLPIKDLTISIEPVQSGSGDPSPTNIRPISGWTGCNAHRTGINIGYEQIVSGKLSSDGTIESDNTRFTITYIPVLPGVTYYFCAPSSAGNGRVAYYDKNKSLVSYSASGWYSGNKTIPDNVYYVSLTPNPNYGATFNNDISVNYPSTHTDYEPCIGTTYPITFPTEAGTVYGGVLDVTTGLLTVDKVMFMIDGTDGISSTLIPHDTYTTVQYVEYQRQGGKINVIFDACDKFKCTAPDDPGLYKVWSHRVGTRMYFGLPPEITTLDEAKAWFAANPTHIVAPLTRESSYVKTYQLTPIEVLTLLGANTIYADTGDTTVTYRADPTLYATKGQTDDDMTADAPIASGAYFQIGSTLYRATTAIATGETIVPGTNCTVTTLAEALNLLNA